MNRNLGRHHPTLRRLRALRRDRAQRDAESVLVAEGLHLVQEALACGAEIELVLASPRLAQRREGRSLLASVDERGLPRFDTSDALIDGVQDARSGQPVLAVVRRPAWPADSLLETAGPAPLIAVAHGLQDPGNLGGLLRTSHAAGASALVVCGDSADRFHPRTVRASMGSIFHLPVFEEAPEALLPRLKQAGIVTVGGDAAAAVDYAACDMTRPIALFFGGEGSGLPADLSSRLTEHVSIPMRREAESLSVGAAAAVLLFEAARQRRAR